MTQAWSSEGSFVDLVFFFNPHIHSGNGTQVARFMCQAPLPIEPSCWPHNIQLLKPHRLRVLISTCSVAMLRYPSKVKCYTYVHNKPTFQVFTWHFFSFFIMFLYIVCMCMFVCIVCVFVCMYVGEHAQVCGGLRSVLGIILNLFFHFID